ncbi:hypothetical protein SAMN05216337_104276 [Bradyrhizobium brasilense]|uniref:ATPase n=1 Tax=Bradyrhizobium brasilense TaxID=1419277 RepID=A0A1G7HNV3_9BRAD|nr:hypothetical protein [Bradyrhizobium brasilense]SDF02058.1 hypothetical protein SAMN05216337_104276 [Bradyrhizobium brasilense]
MERVALLKGITFGERVAEDEIGALGQYFVETDQWERIFEGKIDVIRGDKGSGKSAIYSLLDSKTNQLFDRRVLLTTAENPRGDTVFADLVSEPPTSENEFVFLWKLYYVSLVAAKLKEFGIANDKARHLFAALEEAGIMEPSFSLRRTFLKVRRYVLPKTIEGTVSVDPNTMLSTATGKITLAEPTDEAERRGAVSVGQLAELANAALDKAGYQIWVLFDRLDVAFVEDGGLEKNALRALFRAYRDFSGLDYLKFKIFLRSDILTRIMEGGFREASHITRTADLEWNESNLLNLIVRRALNNQVLVKEYVTDREAILKSTDEQRAFFYRMFPAQVEQGEKKRETFDWIVSRCADGRGKTAPREVIHLLNSLREKEVERIERGGLIPADEALFDRSIFKSALAAVSDARLIGTVYAEYDDLKPYIAQLERQKTEQTIESLRSIWEGSSSDVEQLVQRLVDIGFFQKKTSREEDTYWVPFLYRGALHMSQGLAED